MCLFLGLSTAATIAAWSVAAHGGDVDSARFHDELTRLSVGSFSTLQHARENDGYGVAEAEIVEIWQDRYPAETWFYQEQALLGETADYIEPSQKDRPYFARVIQSVETEPGVVRRSVHRLKDAREALGAWRGDNPLSDLSRDDLLPSECAVTVMRVAKNFWQSTSEKCANAYKGAEYAISLGVVTEGVYANWDRGFTADGAVVWGPSDGGYVFRRKTDREE